MRSILGRIGVFARIMAAALLFLGVCSAAWAQGGEPQYFAIRGARVVPVSGPTLEDAVVVLGRGVIIAVGKDATIPADALVIEGKGLTIYPGLVDGFTDVGIPAAPAAAPGSDAGPRRGGET
ncbi:MAG TPA: hypothetical protein VF758_06390, partial [Candidatus Acidoferrum sp.]